jgi:hypothetical protein
MWNLISGYPTTQELEFQAELSKQCGELRKFRYNSVLLEWLTCGLVVSAPIRAVSWVFFDGSLF